MPKDDVISLGNSDERCNATSTARMDISLRSYIRKFAYYKNIRRQGKSVSVLIDKDASAPG